MQTDVIIQTERLTLREMTHDDYDALYAVLSDSDIMRHYPYTFDEKRVRGWIDRNRQRYSDFGFGLGGMPCGKRRNDRRLRAYNAEYKRDDSSRNRLPYRKDPS